MIEILASCYSVINLNFVNYQNGWNVLFFPVICLVRYDIEELVIVSGLAVDILNLEKSSTILNQPENRVI